MPYGWMNEIDVSIFYNMFLYPDVSAFILICISAIIGLAIKRIFF